MIYLFQGPGAGGFDILHKTFSTEDWDNLRQNVCRLLKARKSGKAAEILSTIPFELFNGTNFFNDDFTVLYFNATLNKYVEIEEVYKNTESSALFKEIAKTISEIGPYVRFIAVGLDTKAEQEVVSPPLLKFTSDAVERALSDAEHLMRTGGAISGVDRVHTSFHGYLETVAKSRGIEVSSVSNITGLFQILTQKYPAFQAPDAQAEQVKKIIRSMATIVDALNPIRNNASMAHPNEILLGEAEAMLVINSVRTLLHYLNSKL